MNQVQPHLLIFSPAGHTKTAVKALAKAWPASYDNLDLSDPEKNVATRDFSSQDLCILGVPSYGGRIPAVATQRLRNLHGDHTPVILLVSYGNRHFDDTLVEMEDVMTQQGFIPVAGVAAIAEHTVCPHYATQRPNPKDRQELLDFGLTIRHKLEEQGPQAVAMPGNRPYRTFGGMPYHPQPTEACIRCGACVVYCPVHAIDPETLMPDPKICFTCMRCVYICPTQARSLPPAFVEAISQKLAPACTQNHPNQLFI